MYFRLLFNHHEQADDEVWTAHQEIRQRHVVFNSPVCYARENVALVVAVKHQCRVYVALNNKNNKK